MARQTTANLKTIMINDIQQKIADGSLQIGSLLGSERELCKQYGTSRATLRKVWALLENEGRIKYIQGRGAFIANPDATKVPAKNIGVILNAQGPYWPLCRNLVQGMQDEVMRQGYSMSLGYSWSSAEKEMELINHFRNTVDGFIIWYHDHPAAWSLLKELTSEGMPVVLVDRMASVPGTSYVGSDNFGGAHEATSHLISLGHQRIAFAHNSHHSIHISTLRDRLYGYATALSEAGLALPPMLSLPTLGPDVIMSHSTENLKMQETVATIQAYMANANLPTAFFCETDYVAVNLMVALRILGIRVGKEVSIIGFDNSEVCFYSDPPLTTVAQDGYKMGTTAVGTLISMIKGNYDGEIYKVIPTQLVKRGSCVPPTLP